MLGVVGCRNFREIWCPEESSNQIERAPNPFKNKALQGARPARHVSRCATEHLTVCFQRASRLTERDRGQRRFAGSARVDPERVLGGVRGKPHRSLCPRRRSATLTTYTGSQGTLQRRLGERDKPLTDSDIPTHGHSFIDDLVATTGDFSPAETGSV